MLKKIILSSFLIVFLSPFKIVFASPSINEIMYDLDGPDIDWVEIYNGDNSDIDLSTLKLFIGNSSSTSNHGINFSSGNTILHSGEYGVIVASSTISNFLNKWGSVANIFTSSFSLPNETAKVEINNGDKTQPISSVVYNSLQGAKEDGNSLQLVNGSWVSATPTPGLQNSDSFVAVDNSSNSNENQENTITTSSSSSSVKKNTTESKNTAIATPKMKAQIIAKSSAYVGIPFVFKGIVLGLDGEQVHRGRYFWNFGDGDFREIKVMNSDKFSHIFFYPGEYNVIFEYYKDDVSDIPDVSQKITIKVVSADIFISKVGDEKDFFVELFNNTIYDADISGWIISSDKKIFIIPKNTIIGPRKKIIISPKITNFSILDKNTLKVETPQGEVVSKYLFTNILDKNLNINKNNTNISPKKEFFSEKDLTLDKINLATVSSDDISTKKSGIFSIEIIFLIFIIVSSVLVYFVRQKENFFAKNDENFEILDE